MQRDRIPVQAEPVSDCKQCNPSACCMGGTLLDLTTKEAAMLSPGVQTIVPPQHYEQRDAPYPQELIVDSQGQVTGATYNGTLALLAAGHGRYFMLGPCVNLKRDLLGRTSCEIYNNRPQACKDFEPGGEKCHKLQSATRLKSL